MTAPTTLAAQQSVAAEDVKIGQILVGPKWVTYRAHHPDSNVYPNTPYRVAVGERVTVKDLR